MEVRALEVVGVKESGGGRGEEDLWVGVELEG